MFILEATAPLGTKMYWTGSNWRLEQYAAKQYSRDNAEILKNSFEGLPKYKNTSFRIIPAK